MPFGVVSSMLTDDAAGVIAAGGRREDGRIHLDLAAHIPLIRLEVAAEATVDVGNPEPMGGPIPSIRVPLAWRSLRHPHLLPVMEAWLEAFPTTPTTTELAIVGEYEPPLGAVGVAADHRVMHRVTSEVVEELLEAIASEMKNRRSLYEPQGRADSDA
jgi:hypothetical protein